MQCCEHQVAGLGQRQRDRDRLQVAHLAQQDHVGILAQRRTQAVLEAVHVGTHLALVHDGAFVRVHELHRILDGEDVARTLLVDAVDHGRQRGALARTRWADHQNQPVRGVQQLGARGRSLQFLQRTNAIGNHPQCQRGKSPLAKGVGAEPAHSGQTEREVDLTTVVVLGRLHGVEEAEHHAFEIARRQIVVALDRDQVAASTNGGRTSDGEMEIGGTSVDGETQQRRQLGVDRGGHAGRHR